MVSTSPQAIQRHTNTVTNAQSPTETTVPTPSPEAGPLTTDDFELDVSVLQEFTNDHPARLRITFKNSGTRELVGMGGPEHILPFVDDNYAGDDVYNEPKLFLLPDNGPYFSIVDQDGTRRSISDVIPDSPTDGSWTLPINWPPQSSIVTPILNAVPVPVGSEVSHEYSLYFIDDCTNGLFTFVNNLEIRVGPRATANESHQDYAVTLKFVIQISDTGMKGSIREPEIVKQSG